MRAGQSAVGGSRQPGPAARGRRARQQSLDSRPDRLLPHHLRPEDRLGLPDRAGAGPERPAHPLAARQGAGRLVVDQWSRLHPRPEGGLRPLAPARQSGVELRRRPALLQARRGSGARARRLPRHRRAALGRRQRPPRAGRGVDRSLPRSRHSEERRLQRRHPGGCGLLPADQPQGLSLLVSRRVPAPGEEAAEPADRDGCAGAPHRPGRPACARRGLPPGRRGADRRRPARDRARGRRHRLAPDPAIVRHRPARAPQRPRHRGGARPAGRRRATCRTTSRRARSIAAPGRSR